MTDLAGRLALVTGAGQGIGRATARILASRGADLLLLDKNPETLNVTAESVAAFGRQARIQALDLTDLEALDHQMAEWASIRTVDILVNNAGFDRPGTTARISPGDFTAVLGIHLTVPLVLIKGLLPGMRAARWGRIVNISSIYGRIGGKGEVAYSAAKAGVIGLTRSVAREAGADGVTVNAVLPGLTRTPTIETVMADRFKNQIIAETPLGRMAEPEEIARVVAFLASDEASYITGAAIPVSGGWGI